MNRDYGRVLKWVRRGAFLAGLGGVVVAGLFLYELVRAPHMRYQAHLRPQEAAMPLPPAASVPVNPVPKIPAEIVAESLVNPISPTPDAIARGKTYYAYYCLYCHGEDGFGHGPVSQHYMPAATNLHDPKYRGYSDGRLLRAMLLGTGHEPVLPRVVRPEHRWYLVLYVREIDKSLP